MMRMTRTTTVSSGAMIAKIATMMTNAMTTAITSMMSAESMSYLVIRG